MDSELEQILQQRDQILVVSGVTWGEYERLLRVRGEKPRPLFAYLDGELEVVVTTSARSSARRCSRGSSRCGRWNAGSS